MKLAKRRTLRDELKLLRRQMTNLSVATADLYSRRAGVQLSASHEILERIAEHLSVLAHPAHVVGASKGEAPFVSVITQRRGGFEALIALDGTGQLWEYHREIDQSTKDVLAEYWTPMVITRREK